LTAGPSRLSPATAGTATTTASPRSTALTRKAIVSAQSGGAGNRGGRTAIFVAWDEPTPMPFLVRGRRGVLAGTIVATRRRLRTALHDLGLRVLASLLGTHPPRRHCNAFNLVRRGRWPDHSRTSNWPSSGGSTMTQSK